VEKTLRWKLAQKLELKWWERYLENKDRSDYLQWKRKYWLDLLATLSPEFKIEPAQKILDTGCGPAGIFIALEGMDVTAIDPLLDQYGEKIDHFKKAQYPYCTFENLGLEELNKSKVFDVVCCLNVINHVRNLEQSMDKLWESVKPSGHLLLSIDGHNFQVLKHIFRLLPGDVLHPQQYDLQEYQDLINARGGTIVKTVLLKREKLFNHHLILARKA